MEVVLGQAQGVECRLVQVARVDALVIHEVVAGDSLRAKSVGWGNIAARPSRHVSAYRQIARRHGTAPKAHPRCTPKAHPRHTASSEARPDRVNWPGCAREQRLALVALVDVVALRRVATREDAVAQLEGGEVDLARAW